MIDKQQSIEGDNNVQISGNHNSVTIQQQQQQQPPLTHSLVHELLDIVYALPSPQDNSFPLKDPAQMCAKLCFNKAHRYKDMIANHTDDYTRVDEVMKNYPDSEDIIKKLRDMFLEVGTRDANGNLTVGDGDAQLDYIKKKLFYMIRTDAHFDANKYPLEKIEQFCIALVACGVSKCKILVVPE